MKLTLGEIRPMIMGLPKVMQEKLPVKTAYWFARTLRELTEHMKPFEETRKNLLDKYGTKDKKGQLVEKDGEFVIRNRKAFDKEFEELANQEVSIKFEGATLEQLGEADIRSIDIYNLGKLIKDEGEPEEKPERRQDEKKSHKIKKIDQEIERLKKQRAEEEKS